MSGAFGQRAAAAQLKFDPDAPAQTRAARSSAPSLMRGRRDGAGRAQAVSNKDAK